MQPRPGTTETLARFVVETRWEDIPGTARHEAKRALLNFFAVALAGCRTEPVALALKIAVGVLRRPAGHRDRPAASASMRLSAAFLNAAGANVFDYCDTHLPTVVHPTAPLAPGAAGAGRAAARDRAAAAAGLRAGLRDRMPGRRRRLAGHYPEGLAHHLDLRRVRLGGGCRQAARPRRAADRVGARHASTQSAGLCECLGWPAKSVSVGNAARNGLWSALLAEKGFAGPPSRSPARRASSPRWTSRRTGRR
jgi:2-methylcitrate dehydratase PrpD